MINNKLLWFANFFWQISRPYVIHRKLHRLPKNYNSPHPLLFLCQSEASSSKSTSTKSWQSPPRDGTHHNSPPHELQTLRRSPPKDVRRSPLHQSESDRHSLNDNNNCKSPRQPSASSERLQTPPPPVPLQASTVDWSYALNFDSGKYFFVGWLSYHNTFFMKVCVTVVKIFLLFCIFLYTILGFL